MDVFYYWKKFDQDMKEGRIGWLLSDRKKMGEMRADRILVRAACPDLALFGEGQGFYAFKPADFFGSAETGLDKFLAIER